MSVPRLTPTEEESSVDIGLSTRSLPSRRRLDGTLRYPSWTVQWSRLVALRALDIGTDQMKMHGFLAMARAILDEVLSFSA